MGADFRDVDNDGKPDIFETAMFGEGFPLYKNLGDGQFQDVTATAGLSALTSRSTAWGVGVFDFDNDGNKDLFTANSDILDNSMELAHRPFPLPNRVFRNKGDLMLRGCECEGRDILLSSSSASRRGLRRPQQRRQDRCRRHGSERPAGDMDESLQQPKPLDHSETGRRQIQPRRSGNEDQDNNIARARSTTRRRLRSATTLRAISACTSGWARPALSTRSNSLGRAASSRF